MSNYFRTKGLRLINKFQKLENNTVIFPSDYFAPYHWWGGGRITKNTMAIQQYSKTWDSKDNSISFIRKVKLNFKHHFPRIFQFLKNIKND